MSLVWCKPPYHSPRSSPRQRSSTRPPSRFCPSSSRPRTKRDNVAALVERLEAALPHVAMEIIFVDDSDDGTPRAVARSRRTRTRARACTARRQRRICGLGGAVRRGHARGARPVGLRHGRRPSAPAGADRRAARAGRSHGDATTSSWRAGSATMATPALRADARDGLAVDHAPPRTCSFPRRLRGVSDPMSGFFLVRREALDLDACARAASRSCSRSSSGTPACASAEVGVQLRRAARRPRARRRCARRCATCASSDCAPAPIAALRPLRDRGPLRPRGQHAAARRLHRRAQALLRGLGGARDAGVRRCGTSCSPRRGCSTGARPPAQPRHRAGHVLPDEQRRARAARPAAHRCSPPGSGSTTWSRT